jgi:uncharacterized protein YecE (DUF72 family)
MEVITRVNVDCAMGRGIGCERMKISNFYVGTAAWAIPKEYASCFPLEGSSILERYSNVLSAVEINSSFHRDHNPETYERWAAATPDGFRFSVKLSRVFTHDRGLADASGLEEVLNGVCRLGQKLRVMLIQLPPSLDFQSRAATRFFRDLRRTYRGPVALEPRHLSWASSEAVRLFRGEGISKVIADPERCPGGFVGEMAYFRLHGSPVIYRSRYDEKMMRKWEKEIALSDASEAWCIFDNTALGFATENALEMQARLEDFSRQKAG